MEKKIQAMRAAYQARNAVRLHKTARDLIAHHARHPFAVVILGEGMDTLDLARRIVALRPTYLQTLLDRAGV